MLRMAALSRGTVAASVVCLALVGFSLNPLRASAFCRANINSAKTGLCQEEDGVPLLKWSRGCWDYNLSQRLIDRLAPLTETEVRDAYDQAFGAWAEANDECSDSRATFQVTQNPEATKTNFSGFVYDKPNESVIVGYTASEWLTVGEPDKNGVDGNDPCAFALTLLWHNSKTGEIFDVDMEMNLDEDMGQHCGSGGAGSVLREKRQFGICDQPCRDGTVDLLNTVTHEAGHVLGLGHTNIAGATMKANADVGENAMRSLEDDDINGLCALDLPEPDCSDASACTCPPLPIVPLKAMVKTTCGCSVPGRTDAGQHGAWWALSMALGAGWIRARRRKR